MLRQSIIKEMELRNNTIAELSRNVKCSYPTLFNWLKGKKESISIPVLENILKEYDLIIVKRY